MTERGTLAAELEAAVAHLQDLAARVRELENNGTPVDTSPARLLTIDEAVQRTLLPKGRLYALARQGEAGAVRIGVRSVRFNSRALDAWLESGGSR